MSSRDQLVLQEVVARAQQRLAVADIVKAIRAELFDKQLAVIDDTSKLVAPICSRRAGKTNIWPRAATICALERPRSLIRIWAVSLLRAKQLVWDELIRLHQRHKLEVKYNETTHTMKFPNGSEIRLLGADKLKEAEKKRGDKTAMEIIIESQLFGGYLEKIVDDIAGPGLADLDGTFYCEGTPGPVCAGHWYSISGGNDTASRWISPGRSVQGSQVGGGWSCHRWTLLDNPYPSGKEHWHNWLTRKKAAMRWADDNPTYLREYLGKWVNDYDALFYAFDPVRNTFLPTEREPWGPGWMHTLGWDLGFRDDMALVVWGFHPLLPDLYEAFSWKKPEVRSASVVIDEIVKLEQRKFNIIKMVADTGGGGKMYVEDVMKRFPYSFEPAQKQHKYDHVRLLNDDLRTGFVKLAQGSPYALEMAELPKAPDEEDDSKEAKAPKEHPAFANHCCDAGLYAYRGSMHYLHQEGAKPVKPGTAEHYAREEARMLENIHKKRAKDGATWLERYDSPSDDFLENG